MIYTSAYTRYLKVRKYSTKFIETGGWFWYLRHGDVCWDQIAGAGDPALSWSNNEPISASNKPNHTINTFSQITHIGKHFLHKIWNSQVASHSWIKDEFDDESEDQAESSSAVGSIVRSPHKLALVKLFMIDVVTFVVVMHWRKTQAR